MPRVYEKKEDGFNEVPHDVMLLAVKDVVDNGMSVRKAGKVHGISKSSLDRYTKKYQSDPSARLEPNYQQSLVFDKEEEQKLSEYLVACSKMFHGLTTHQTREIAFQMALKNNKKVPLSWKSEGMAGREWMYAFLKRNTNLALRTPEATSLARAAAFNKHNVMEFFTNLGETLKKNRSDWCQNSELGRNGLYDGPKTTKSNRREGQQADRKGYFCRTRRTRHDVRDRDWSWRFSSASLRLSTKDCPRSPHERCSRGSTGLSS